MQIYSSIATASLHNRGYQPLAPITTQPLSSACGKIAYMLTIICCFEKVLMFALPYAIFVICLFLFSHSSHMLTSTIYNRSLWLLASARVVYSNFGYEAQKVW